MLQGLDQATTAGYGLTCGSGAAKVQLGTLGVTPQAVAVPGRQPLQQDQSLQQLHVRADSRSADLERRSKIRTVEQPGRLGRRWSTATLMTSNSSGA